MTGAAAECGEQPLAITATAVPTTITLARVHHITFSLARCGTGAGGAVLNGHYHKQVL
jgi:hypothetical protein